MARILATTDAEKRFAVLGWCVCDLINPALDFLKTHYPVLVGRMDGNHLGCICDQLRVYVCRFDDTQGDHGEVKDQVIMKEVWWFIFSRF